MIVIKVGGASIGLIVDCVSRALTNFNEDIKEKWGNSGDGCGYAKSSEKGSDHTVRLIDCKKFISAEEFDAVSA